MDDTDKRDRTAEPSDEALARMKMDREAYWRIHDDLEAIKARHQNEYHTATRCPLCGTALTITARP